MRLILNIDTRWWALSSDPMKRTPDHVAATADAEPPADATATLRRAGQRVTKHRAAVIGTLRTADRPLVADDVAKRAGVPLSTAYRNLAELCEAGVAVRVGGAGRTDRYEIAETVSSHHHHHLVCTTCGEVTDFDPSPQLERLIAKELQALVAEADFVESHHLFDVHGVCGNCRD
jgi:Fe2+ or Zn2+ uptake regulation protein